MINQEFKVLGRKFQMLPNFGICCRGLRELKVASFRACVPCSCSVVVTHVFRLFISCGGPKRSPNVCVKSCYLQNTRSCGMNLSLFHCHRAVIFFVNDFISNFQGIVVNMSKIEFISIPLLRSV